MPHKNASKGAGLLICSKGKMMSSARSYDLPTMLLKGAEEQNQCVRQPMKTLAKKKEKKNEGKENTDKNLH